MKIPNPFLIVGIICLIRAIFLVMTPTWGDPIKAKVLNKIWRYFKNEH